MIRVLDDNYLAVTILVTLGMQYSFFAIAFGCEFDKVTDIAVSERPALCCASLRHAIPIMSGAQGTMNFVLLGWLTFGLAGNAYGRQM